MGRGCGVRGAGAEGRGCVRGLCGRWQSAAATGRESITSCLADSGLKRMGDVKMLTGLANS